MASVASPRLEALFSTARRVWEDRDDLRHRFGSPESLGYWNWLMAEGTEDYPEILEHLPLPPRSLISRVVGDVSPDTFRAMGLSDAQNVYPYLLEAGFDPTAGPALLDFGCGCGRILRFFARFADSCRLFGADVDAEAIAWCRASYDFASFSTLSPAPPSPFAADRFDAVYLYSVFSHLTEERHRQWLEELHRITRPGAAVVATVQGRNCFEMFCLGMKPESGLPSPDELRDDAPELRRSGFRFYPYDSALPWMPPEEPPGGRYGMAFILEHYVREHWLDLFDLVAFHDSPQDWQDYVVLRTRK